MTMISPVRRRAAALLATLAVGVAGAIGAGSSPAVALTTSDHQVAREVARTTITFHVTTCPRCQVRLYQAIEGDQDVWEPRTKQVRHGEVSFTVRKRHTHGLSASVRAPWEGNTGYITQVVFRYGHEAVGSKVAFTEATHKKRGAGCWAGTDKDAVTIPLQVRKLTVLGNTGETDGTIAWTGRTRAWWQPMLPTFDGVLGSQDVFFCDKP